MASTECHLIAIFAALLASLVARASAIDIFLEWNVALDNTTRPVSVDQPVITINGMFPGPLIKATTNDFIHVNVFNNMDEPLLFTWYLAKSRSTIRFLSATTIGSPTISSNRNGIQQRLNSWQDGVSGTNCPIKPGTNWTYVFQTKDQIGTFFYFPSINFQKAAGGFGPIRVNNRDVIAVPFPKPEAEFDLLTGDWNYDSYKWDRVAVQQVPTGYRVLPDAILMNGKGAYGNQMARAYESFTVTQGKTYGFRISNVGTEFSLNFRIQNHQMVLVETEGSYTNQIVLDSLDVHVGQSYSVLVTANQNQADYYIVATPKLVDLNDTDYKDLVGVGVLHYSNSTTPVSGPLPDGPGPFDIEFSVNQAKSIRWNLTTGAARPNPQGTFNVTNVTLSQTFILQDSGAEINGSIRRGVNNVSYYTPDTPLKLADYFVNGSGVYQLDAFPTHSVNDNASYGISVVSGIHKGWHEIVFHNKYFAFIDSWHFDGFGFYVVGWNLTTGAARPNPQGTFNVTNVTLSQTFILQDSGAEINGSIRRGVNNVSYYTPDTPLKLADYFVNGSGVYQLDAFPTHSVNDNASYGISVVSGIHKGWHEIVFHNKYFAFIDSWHFDGFGFYVVGFGNGDWTPEQRSTYNLYDPVVRSTVQVYPGGWTAVYAFLDNPGMWNLRSQVLKHWYLGQELYVRVFDADPNPAKERPPPENLLLCGIFDESQPPFSAPPLAPVAGR
ncbi:monocopper oxidase-like protein SKS1 [Morus notabilis]|uniref:monocopper oxidase-like protein SKS1 n=1 Tax=Morus notabilis TaxID=981085 RepID=UPI000CED0C98|nr:monocopper oxidase-like protein SKS1 [Morus notabilis]